MTAGLAVGLQKVCSYWKIYYNQTAVLPDDISKANPEVIAHHPVHANFLIRAAIVGQYDANGLPPFLSLQQHSVSPEKLKLVHLGLKLWNVASKSGSVNNCHINTHLRWWLPTSGKYLLFTFCALVSSNWVWSNFMTKHSFNFFCRSKWWIFRE